MIDEKDTNAENENNMQQILQPVSVANYEIPQANERTIEVPAGHVYIVALDADGVEMENSGFFYPERNYKRIYGNEKKYSVKKKAH